MVIHNKNLTSILWIIGKSETLLSSGQIENQSQLSKYVYDMLEYLAPKDNYTYTKLFVLKDIPHGVTKESKYDILSKIIKKYQLSWVIDKEQIELKVKIQLITKGHLISLKILYEKDKYIIIKDIYIHFPENYYKLEIQDGIEKKEYRCIIKRNQKKEIVLYALNPIFRNNYLDITYSSETQQKIMLIEDSNIRYFGTTEHEIDTIKIKSLEKRERIERLKRNRSHWRYSLNIVGFIQYLYLESNNKRRDRRKRVKAVISNPAIRKKFIFLNLWEEYEKMGFDVIDFLFNIANEFQNRLYYDKTRLLLLITERYLFQIDYFLSKLEFKEFIEIITKRDFIPLNLKIKDFNQYRLEMLEYIHKNLNSYLWNIDDRIQELKEKLII